MATEPETEDEPADQTEMEIQEAHGCVAPNVPKVEADELREQRKNEGLGPQRNSLKLEPTSFLVCQTPASGSGHRQLHAAEVVVRPVVEEIHLLNDVVSVELGGREPGRPRWPVSRCRVLNAVARTLPRTYSRTVGDGDSWTKSRSSTSARLCSARAQTFHPDSTRLSTSS